jgi:hypothetical protein
MRPIVEDAQDLRPGTPQIAAHQSRAGVQVLKWGTKIAAFPVIQSLASNARLRTRSQPLAPAVQKGANRTSTSVIPNPRHSIKRTDLGNMGTAQIRTLVEASTRSGVRGHGATGEAPPCRHLSS